MNINKIEKNNKIRSSGFENNNNKYNKIEKEVINNNYSEDLNINKIEKNNKTRLSGFEKNNNKYNRIEKEVINNNYSADLNINKIEKEVINNNYSADLNINKIEKNKKDDNDIKDDIQQPIIINNIVKPIDIKQKIKTIKNKNSQFNINKLTRLVKKNKKDNNDNNDNLHFNGDNDISSNFDKNIKKKKYIYFKNNIEDKIEKELYFTKYIEKKNDIKLIDKKDIAVKLNTLDTILQIYLNLVKNKLIVNIEIKYYQQLELDIFYSLISLNYYYKNIDLLTSIKSILKRYLNSFRKYFNKFIYNYAIYLNIVEDIRYLNNNFLIIYYTNNKSSTNIKIIITLIDSISKLNDIVSNLNNYNNILNKNI